MAGTTAEATKEGGEPNHAADPGGTSVWYQWTAPTSDPVTIDTCGSTTDTLLGVYTGATLGTLASAGANDDGCDTGTSSSVRFTPTGGVAYRIAVDTYVGGVPGPFQLRLRQAAAPANDLFSARASFAGATAMTSGSTLSATKEAGEPNHSGNVGGVSAWYEWTAPSTGKFRFQACAPTFLPLLGIYTGAAVNALTTGATIGAPSACGSGNGRAVNLRADSGVTYMIAVDGTKRTAGVLPAGTTPPGQGNFDLSVRPLNSPANDDFASAGAVTGAAQDVTGTTSEATAETGEPNHGGQAAGASVWYAWTAPSSGQFSFSTCGTASLNALVGVYTGASVGALTPVPGQQQSRCTAGDRRVIFTATIGTAYRIAVNGAGVGEGPFTLRLGSADPPANDNFLAAQLLTGSSATVQATNVGATMEGGEPEHVPDGAGIGASVWYVWTAPATGSYRVQICGPRLSEMYPFVYIGSSLASLTAVADLGDVEEVARCGQDGWRSDFQATAGQVYRFAVDGALIGPGLTGPEQDAFEFRLRSVSRPPNDAFASAQELTGTDTTVPGTTVEATAQPTEPLAPSDLVSVWYHWTAPVSGEFKIDTCGAEKVAFTFVYTGTSLGALTEKRSDVEGLCRLGPALEDLVPGGKVLLDAVQGESFWIQILTHDQDEVSPMDAFTGEGTFDLHLVRIQNFTEPTSPTDPVVTPPEIPVLGAPANQAPDTQIDSVKAKPGKKTGKATVTFSGSDDGPGTLEFECMLDTEGFSPCSSPEVFKKLKPGKHSIAVRAIDGDGKLDRSPAETDFKVKKKKA
jgi:hypothetical protein